MKTTEFLTQNAPWLASGALLTFLSSFGQTYFISIFGASIQTEFGLSHGAWGGIYALGTAASALLMIWAGGLSDRFRVRQISVIILSLLACACVFMAFNTAVWALPITIFALRFAGQGMTSHLAKVAMARWFIATRGKALSIATLGFAFGEALLPLLFVFLLSIVDWRVLWIAAAVIILISIPALTRMLRTERTPQSMASQNGSPGMQGKHWQRKSALRHPLFWFMVPAILGPPAFNTVFFFHQVHFSALKGLNHIQFVSMLPLYTGVGIAAMVLSGIALDRFGTARLIPFYQLPMVVAFCCFAFAQSIGFTLLGFVFLAITSGANSTLPSAFWAEFYGTKHIGSIKAIAAAVMVLGSAIGPGLTGYLIDIKIGLETQYLGIAAFFVFSSAMMLAGVKRFARNL